MNKANTTVLVTGASGFVGAHAVKQLLEEGYNVRGSVRSTKDLSRYQWLLDLPRQVGSGSIQLVEGDLMDKNCWYNAVDGCDYVLHIASPVSAEKAKTEDDYVKPAVNGVKNVLHAAIEKGVKKVVITSSIASIMMGHKRKKLNFDEGDWSVEKKLGHYAKSKYLAERAAWDIYEANKNKIEISVINPGLILGAPVGRALPESAIFSKMILSGKLSSTPNFSMGFVHVKDVAKLHILAMESDEANGKRYICSGEDRQIPNMAKVIYDEYRPRGYKISKKKMGGFMIWLGSLFDAQMKMMKEFLDRPVVLDNSKSRKELGISYIGFKEMNIETCEWLLTSGNVKRSKKDTH